MIDVTMPQLGESVDSGTVSRWLKDSGDTVEVDEPLFEVTSDKVTMEIPSLAAGRLSEIIVREGDEVPVGSVVARIADADEYAASVPASDGSSEETHAHATTVNGRNAFSPVVRRLAREHNVDLAAVVGSARKERITKHDVLNYVASLVGTQSTHGSEPAAIASVPSSTPETRVPAPEPAVAQIVASRAVESPPKAASPTSATPRPMTSPTLSVPSSEHATRTSRDRVEPLSPLRRTMVQRLTAAQKSAVNVFSVIEIDMESVADARKARKLTYLPFVVRAVVDALRAYPRLNASFSAEASTLTYHEDVHLGIAVDLDERGLVVPVVRDAHLLTVEGLAREIARLADAARAGTLPAAAYAGSTFSITNNGAFGALMSAPVINASNVAIVSTDAVEERPVVINSMIAIRRRMYFCMTWDHRAFDGSTAARFLAYVKHALEDRDWSIQ